MAIYIGQLNWTDIGIAAEKAYVYLILKQLLYENGDSCLVTSEVF